LSEATPVKVTDTPASETVTVSPSVAENTAPTGTTRPFGAVEVVVEVGLVVDGLDVVDVAMVVTGDVDATTVVTWAVWGNVGTVVGDVDLNADSSPPHAGPRATIAARPRAADARCTGATLRSPRPVHQGFPLCP